MFSGFSKIDILRGDEKDCELMGQQNTNGKASENEGGGVGKSKLLAEEIVRSYNEGKIVYCRFGKQYVLNLEK